MPAVLNNYMTTFRKHYATARENDKTAANKIYDEQEKVAQDTYNASIKDAKADYDDMHKENAIQKLINENEVAEDMANMGHNDSGLNRTQQTAVQLSYANNKSSIDRQRQARIDTLAQNLATELSRIKQERISAIADIDKVYEDAITSSAQEAYKTYQDEETKRNDRYYSYLEKQEDKETINAQIVADMQKASISEDTKAFMGGLFTESELARRNYTTKVGDKTMRFDNRTQYVEAVMKDYYIKGKLTANEVAYLKGYYGIE